MFTETLLIWQNKDVTKAIQKFVIGGNKVILIASNPETKVDDAEFEENEAYAVDIVTSTGDGKVVSFVKWLEDELELNALHNPGSRRGSGNEKAALVQRSALCAALGGQVEVGAMSTIAGIYLNETGQ
ncbi:hypothetical protein IFM89_006602 [Coptis chinensis]|uniref:PI4-kinase N-terminal domain-containing protein n=1 Tax=Coptis chinensis TaxID=261450 RepID=A0A835II59_9MAGN|nr:hypothetical protein IFM89_006602 [Coptis chinensis]